MSLGKSSYFSDVNPKNMRRLMNIIAVTGRLLDLKNFKIPFLLLNYIVGQYVIKIV